jgi:hypothetical protein
MMGATGASPGGTPNADARQPAVRSGHDRAAHADGSTKRIFGIPLGYFLACHGLLIIAFATVAVFVNRQDAIDHWHGAHEDI